MLHLHPQVSFEEWEIVGPTEKERAMTIIMNIKTHLETSGSCSNCTRWMMEVGSKNKKITIFTILI